MNDYISRHGVIKAVDKFIPADPMKSDYTQGITVGLALATRCIEEFSQETDESSQGLVKDLISSQDAKDVVDMELDAIDHVPEWVYDRLLTALDKVPSAQPEQRWIPCSERLPETHKAGNSVSGIFMKSKPVLVYGVPEYESEYSFNVVTYCDDLNGITYWSTEMDAVTINEVTAWMPLPEPYKERREE